MVLEELYLKLFETPERNFECNVSKLQQLHVVLAINFKHQCLTEILKIKHGIRLFKETSL